MYISCIKNNNRRGINFCGSCCCSFTKYNATSSYRFFKHVKKQLLSATLFFFIKRNSYRENLRVLYICHVLPMVTGGKPNQCRIF